MKELMVANKNELDTKLNEYTMRMNDMANENEMYKTRIKKITTVRTFFFIRFTFFHFVRF